MGRVDHARAAATGAKEIAIADVGISVNWRVLFVGVFRIRALNLWGVYQGP